jgi:hypothetical protein
LATFSPGCAWQVLSQPSHGLWFGVKQQRLLVSGLPERKK